MQKHTDSQCLQITPSENSHLASITSLRYVAPLSSASKNLFFQGVFVLVSRITCGAACHFQLIQIRMQLRQSLQFACNYAKAFNSHATTPKPSIRMQLRQSLQFACNYAKAFNSHATTPKPSIRMQLRQRLQFCRTKELKQVSCWIEKFCRLAKLYDLPKSTSHFTPQ